MLKQEDLTEVLHEAMKATDTMEPSCRCGRFCTTGATIDDDQRYVLHHNGTGSHDTDIQRVSEPGILGLSKETLRVKVVMWLIGIHTGQRVDLNAMMAPGGPIFADAPYLVGESGPELFVPTRGPAMTGWPWRWTDGTAP